MVAAVSDYVHHFHKKEKTKKRVDWNFLEFRVKTKYGHLKVSIYKDGIVSIGFKAEMDLTRALNSATRNA